MWSSPDVLGLFSNNVVSFSRNVVLRELLFSLNSVSKPRMLSVRADYVLSSLQLAVLIDAERQCCPFLTFVLQVPARKNALVLEIKGPEGAKRLIRAELLDD